ncbi:MAG TPA: Fe-S cluster assembly protein SufD [Vicinamibacteria bacterium]|nr:Fe-S cluster assembly protein SufD [Vicinamibacteria bacterium]
MAGAVRGALVSAAVAGTAPERAGLDTGFEAFAAARPANEPEWLTALRRTAIARFRELGLPTMRDEDWRHTPLTPIARASFVVPPREARVAAGRLGDVMFGRGFEGHQVVVVNGRLAPDRTSGASRSGIRVMSLAEALEREPQVIQADLDAVARERGSAFAALNTAFLEDGVLVDVPAGAGEASCVHVVHYATSEGAAGPTVSHPRVLVRVGRTAQVTVVESFTGPDGDAYFTNAVTEFVLGEGAIVDHYRVQREGDRAVHVATLAVRQGRDSRFGSHAITLGATLSRLEVDQVFAGAGAECALLGLFMGDGRQHHDTHTRIDHAQPHCTSREVYKGVLGGRARGVFVGRILVRKDAQKTDAQQTNKNLLLSREALVHSVPQLEILADDVKCKHGSTTGQIDPAALFYLRSRGIGETAARSLLVYAFASDLVGRIKVEPLRAGLGEYLRTHLPDVAEVEEAVV